jgi:hypothetical protein
MVFEVDNDALPTHNITPLPTAMTAAAFLGIAWYLSVEVSVRLLTLNTRRSLYFWSCLACSWGIIIHAVFIVLLDFKIWESYGAVVIIHLCWWTYVVSQSVVLYSRLNLVLQRLETGRYVLYMIITTSIIFGLGTVVLGMVAVRSLAQLSLLHIPRPFCCHRWYLYLLTTAALPHDGRAPRPRQPRLGSNRTRRFLSPRDNHLSTLHP